MTDALLRFDADGVRLRALYLDRKRRDYAKRRRSRPKWLTDADIERCHCGAWIVRDTICTTCAAMYLRLKATQ